MLIIWLVAYLLIGISFARTDVDTDSFRRKVFGELTEDRNTLTKLYFLSCILLWPIRAVVVIVRMLVGEKK